MPSRRRLLRTCGVGLGLGLAGCVSSVPFVGGPPEIHEKSGESLDRGVPPSRPDLSANSTTTTLAVGRGSDHHQVWVWNETDRERTVTVEIGDESGSDPWFSRTYDLDPDANLAIDLRESRAYAITVRVDGRAETVGVPESRFDCNASATDVAVREDEIKTSGISTSMGCGGLW